MKWWQYALQQHGTNIAIGTANEAEVEAEEKEKAKESRPTPPPSPKRETTSILPFHVFTSVTESKLMILSADTKFGTRLEDGCRVLS